MRSKLTELMSGMIDKYPRDIEGVFVLSFKNMKDFRKSTGTISGSFKGYKVRKVKQAPNDKIYLLSEKEYHELIEGLKSPISIINKQKNETDQKIN